MSLNLFNYNKTHHDDNLTQQVQDMLQAIIVACNMVDELLDDLTSKHHTVEPNMTIDDVCKALPHLDLNQLAYRLTFQMSDTLTELLDAINFYKTTPVTIKSTTVTERDRANDIKSEIPQSPRNDRPVTTFIHSTKSYPNGKSSYHRWSDKDLKVLINSVGLSVDYVQTKLNTHGSYPTIDGIISKVYSLGLHVRKGVICGN